MAPLEYDPIPGFDEESNKSTTTGLSGLSRTRSRLLNRALRIVNVLLTLALLAYLYRRSSVDLTSMLEFRNNEHHRFLDSVTAKWDARRAFKEAKYLHFQDWPYPKPWSGYSHVMHDEWQPACEITIEGEEDCSSRDVWDEIYDEFLARRQVSHLFFT